MKYDAIKTSQLLSDALLFKENKDGERFNIAKACSHMGISRKRFYDLLNGKSHEPTISVLAKVIQYFKEEGFIFQYKDFLEVDVEENNHYIQRSIQIKDADNNVLQTRTIKITSSVNPDNLEAYQITNSPYNALSKDEIIIVDSKNKGKGNYLLCVKYQFCIARKSGKNYIDIFNTLTYKQEEITLKGKIIDVFFA